MSDKDKKKEHIESDKHETFGSLLRALHDTTCDQEGKFANRETLRAFYNMRDTLTEDQEEELGREESTNFGSAFRGAMLYINPLEAIVNNTDSLFEIKFSKYGGQIDVELGEEASDLFNQGAINEQEDFQIFWRTAIGEGYLTGGGCAINEYSDSGIFPYYNPECYFPKGSPLSPDKMGYMFERVDIGVPELKEMLHAIDEDEEGEYINKEQVEAIIKFIDNKSSSGATQTDTGSDLAQNNPYSSRDDDETSGSDILFKVWRYWEVRFKDEDDTDDEAEDDYVFVSCVMFVETGSYTSDDDGGLNEDDSDNERPVGGIIYQERQAHKHPKRWMRVLDSDEEIGGIKRVDTLRGIGEAQFKAAVLLEELKNMEVEGAMQDAKHTMIDDGTGNPEDKLQFQLGVDPVAPQGINKILELPNRSTQFRPIVQDLMNTMSSITGSERSSPRIQGEGLPQQKQRLSNDRDIFSNRIRKWYKHGDNLGYNMVQRIMTLKPERGTDDYLLIKWFQNSFDRKIIKVFALDEPNENETALSEEQQLTRAKEIREELAEEEYGKPKYLSVNMSRSTSGLDRVSEQELGQFILQLISTGQVEAQLVPELRYIAVLLFSGNPDVAKLLKKDIAPIKTDQQTRAAFEFDIIRRRAFTGDPFPTNPNDVHEDHAEAHLIDMIAFVNAHGTRPWDQQNVVEISAVIEHVAQHLEQMRALPESKAKAQELFPQFQQAVATIGAIIQVLDEENLEQAQATKEEAEIEEIRSRTALNFGKLEMLGRRYGLDLERERSTQRQRFARENRGDSQFQLMTRSQLVGEVQKDRELRIKEQASRN